MSSLDLKSILLFEFANTFYDAAVMLAIDDLTQAIVIIVRGTLSSNETLVDMLALGEPLRQKDYELPPEERFVAHGGMIRVARALSEKILREGWVEKARISRPDYPLVMCGHSLGAGLVSLMSVLLRTEYPELKAYAFEPPGALMNEQLSEYTRDFLVSTIHGSDVVGRLGVATLEDLRARLMHALVVCNVSKRRILRGRLARLIWRFLFSWCRVADLGDIGSLLSPEVKAKLLDPDLDDVYNSPIGACLKENKAEVLAGASHVDRLLDTDRSIMKWKKPEARTLLRLSRPVPRKFCCEPEDALTIDKLLLSLPDARFGARVLFILKVDGDFEIPGARTFKKRGYEPPPIAVWADASNFNSILVLSRMLADHSPIPLCTALDHLYAAIESPDKVFPKFPPSTYARKVNPLSGVNRLFDEQDNNGRPTYYMNQIVDIDKLLDDLQCSISENEEVESSILHPAACKSEKANKPSRNSDVCPSAETDSCIVYPSFEKEEEEEVRKTPEYLSPSTTEERPSTLMPVNEGPTHRSSSSDNPDENSSPINFPSKMGCSLSVGVDPLPQLTPFPKFSAAHVPDSPLALSNSPSHILSQSMEQFCSYGEPFMTTECTETASLSLSRSSDPKAEVSETELTHHATAILPARPGPPPVERNAHANTTTQCSATNTNLVPPASETPSPKLLTESPLPNVAGEVSAELEPELASVLPNEETTARLWPPAVLPSSESERSSFSPGPESTQEEFHSLTAESSSFSSFRKKSLTPTNNAGVENFSSAAQSADENRGTLTGLPPTAVLSTGAEPNVITKVASMSSWVYRTPPNHLIASDFSTDSQCAQSPSSPGFPMGKSYEQTEVSTSFDSPRTTDFDESPVVFLDPASDVVDKPREVSGMNVVSGLHPGVPSSLVTDGRSLSEDDLTDIHHSIQPCGTNNDFKNAPPIPPPPSSPFIAEDEVGVELPVQEELPASEQEGDGGEIVSEVEVPAAEHSTTPITDTADWPVSLSADEIGTREPTWVADDAYSNCMSCGAKFTVWRRRHHCRTCGRLLCSQCTPARLRLAFATTRSAEGEAAASGTITEVSDSAAAAAPAATPTSASPLRSSAKPPSRPNPSLERRLMKLISGQSVRLHRVCTDCFEVLSVHPAHNPSGNAEINPEGAQSRRIPSAAPDSSVNELDGNATPVPHRRTFSPQDAVDALTDNCLIPSRVADEFGHLECRWPPLVVHSENNLEFQPNPSAEKLISLLGTSAPQVTDASSGVTFAVTQNLLVHVYLTPLTCCLAQDAWCFISSGLQAVGHNEVLLLIRRRPNELLPPLDALWQYFALYDMALDRGRASHSQPCDISSPRLHDGICLLEPPSSYYPTAILQQPIGWFQETTGQEEAPSAGAGWAGFLYFHPSNQCLLNLRLPEPPFLCGVLVHAWEAAWARHLPLRLRLCLGRLSASADTSSLSPSLLSDRDRPSVFPQAAHDSILSVFFSDLAGQSDAEAAADMPFLHVPRLEIVLRGKVEEDSLQLQLTFNSLSSHLAKSLFTKRLRNCLLLGLSGDFVQSADSHLVCSYPSEGGGCQSECLPCNRHDQSTRTVPTTGASFVVFEGGASQSSLSIVEDGCVARLTAEQFTLLTSALRARRPLSLNAVSAQTPSAPAIVTVVWLGEEAEVNMLPSPFTTRFSWIDGRPIPSRLTFCLPPEQQVRHWLMTTQQSSLRTPSSDNQAQMVATKPLVAWVRLHKLGEPSVFAVDNQSGESLDLSAVTNAIVCAFITALVPYVRKLLVANVTQFALRIRLQPPTVFNFLIGSPSLWSDVRTVTSSDVTFCSQSIQGRRRWWWLRQPCAPAADSPDPMLHPSQLPLLEDSGYINDVDSALIPMLDGLTRNITCRRLVEQASTDATRGDDDSQPPPALEFEFDFTLHG
ncbi:Zinc finger FYVE domain-containing protein 9 [Sparganum proliferum]